MEKFLTDVHNHSTFSADGVSELSDMLQTAQEKGVAFYGVSEHFNGDLCLEARRKEEDIDAEAYFHAARHLQEDYAGVMNVLVGAELGYTEEESVQAYYCAVCEKYRPDFIVNSIHSFKGWDYYKQKQFFIKDEKGNAVLRDQREAYEEYFALLEKSLDAPYPYDIVGHLGYVSRYYPRDNKEIRYADYAQTLDRILKNIIEKGKILEANSAVYDLKQTAIPGEDVFRRYFELGGRKVSYASDAHQTTSILRGRKEIVKMLKGIGFTYITVPCQGEHIKVEI